MNLIIFDIDGTLTQTNEVDARCFTYAIEDILNLKKINTDWSTYKYSTDSGLLKEIFANFLQREPHPTEINLIRESFVAHLKQAWQQDKSLYASVPGAEYIFDQIRRLTNWHIAIATGGWKKSALFKLDSALIPHASLPKAFADDHFERSEIIRIAIKQAQAIHRVHHYQRIVYVGDREWDKRAAATLNIEFIGVGPMFSNHPSEHHIVINDYRLSPLLLSYLTQQSTNMLKKQLLQDPI